MAGSRLRFSSMMKAQREALNSADRIPTGGPVTRFLTCAVLAATIMVAPMGRMKKAAAQPSSAESVQQVGQEIASRVAKVREAFEKLSEIDDFGGTAYDQEIASNGAIKAALQTNQYAVGYLGWPYKDSTVEYADVAGHGDPVSLTVEPTDPSLRHFYLYRCIGRKEW